MDIYAAELYDDLQEIFEGMTTEISVLCADMVKYQVSSLEEAKAYLLENAKYYDEYLTDHILYDME